MSFIDWSDPEEMLGLLVEYLLDAQADAENARRRVFLAELAESAAALQGQFTSLTPAAQVRCLQALHESVDDEFADDPVVAHVVDCAAELRRIHGDLP